MTAIDESTISIGKKYKDDTSTQIIEIDLTDRKARIRAVQAVLDGNVVAGHMRRVYGFWIDAGNPSARAQVAAIKGESADKKMSIMTTGSFIVPHIDKDRIKPELRHFVSDPAIYSSTFGSLCHTVLPIHPNSLDVFPDTVTSTWGEDTHACQIVYNLDPSGHPGMEPFIRDLEMERVIPAVTSMNPTSTPEITNLKDAWGFMKTLHPGVSPQIMMRDHLSLRDDILGSFTQIHMILGTVIRDGHIPAHILGWMLGLEVDPSKLKKHKYPHGSFDQKFNNTIKEMNPAEIRNMLLNFIHSSE